MTAVVYPLCAAVTWLALLLRLARPRAPWRDPAQLVLLATLSLLALAFTTASPAVFQALNGWAAGRGLPNLGTLLMHSFVTAFATLVQILVITWVTPADRAWRAARARAALGVSTVATMAALFIGAGIRETSPDYLVTHLDNRLVAAYLGVYLTMFAVAMVEIARICLFAAGKLHAGWLRLGLRLTAAGALTGQGYTASRALGVAGVAWDWNLYRWEPLAPLSAGVGALLLVTGLTIPAWGGRLASLRRLWSHWRDYQALAPLWRLVHQELPELILDPPRAPWRDRVPLWRLRYRLYRRIVEIQDARLAVQDADLGPDVAPRLRAAFAAPAPPGPAAGPAREGLGAPIGQEIAALKALARGLAAGMPDPAPRRGDSPAVQERP